MVERAAAASVRTVGVSGRTSRPWVRTRNGRSPPYGSASTTVAGADQADASARAVVVVPGDPLSEQSAISISTLRPDRRLHDGYPACCSEGGHAVRLSVGDNQREPSPAALHAVDQKDLG